MKEQMDGSDIKNIMFYLYKTVDLFIDIIFKTRIISH